MVLAEVRNGQEHGRIAFAGVVDVDTAKAKASIADALDAKRARRKLLTKAATVVVGLLTGFVVHWLVSHLGWM